MHSRLHPDICLPQGPQMSSCYREVFCLSGGLKAAQGSPPVHIGERVNLGGLWLSTTYVEKICHTVRGLQGAMFGLYQRKRALCFV